MRQAEVLEKTTVRETDAKRDLDRLEADGEIKRFTVGEHVMVKATGALYEETKDRAWPRSDKSCGYASLR